MNDLAVSRFNLIFDTILELDNLLCEQAYSTEHLDILHEEFEEDIQCMVTTWYLTAVKLRTQIGYNDERLRRAEEMLAGEECDCTCGEFDTECH